MLQELTFLKAEIFQSNLAVHRLLAAAEDYDDYSAAVTTSLEKAREEIIGLYSLWTEASSALSCYKEGELRRRLEATSSSSNNGGGDQPGRKRKQRRRRGKQSEKRLIELRAASGSPDDSGYSEAATANIADPKAAISNRAGAVEVGLLSIETTTVVEAKTPEIVGSAVAAGRSISGGWLGRVGRAAMYSCLVVAALLPLALYQARPPQCCEYMYPTPHWIHFQYVNGPPPI
jgi:hypothetical protein